MAVNKITNKQVVSKETINRANQVSTKNETVALAAVVDLGV